jgi:hypothetical protein
MTTTTMCPGQTTTKLTWEDVETLKAGLTAIRGGAVLDRSANGDWILYRPDARSGNTVVRTLTTIPADVAALKALVEDMRSEIKARAAGQASRRANYDANSH